MRSIRFFPIRQPYPIVLLAGFVLLAGCAGTSGPAPVVNRSLEMPQAKAPVFDSRHPDTGRQADKPAARELPAPEAPLAAAEPATSETMEAAEEPTGVQSIPIESGRVESSPIAADEGAGSAPIITMGPAISRDEPPAAGAAPSVAAPPVAQSETPSEPAPAMPPVAVATPSTQAPVISAPAAQAPAAQAPSAAATESDRPFIWPASGAVTKSFTDPKSMGIAIAGKAGDPVSAAGDGRVIFSGLGPRGYGKLLIVKHDDDLLSVYANNRALLVKEGQAVRQGQKIAELGSSGTDSPRLHFEVRRLGKPVDPISYLPPSVN